MFQIVVLKIAHVVQIQNASTIFILTFINSFAHHTQQIRLIKILTKALTKAGESSSTDDHNNVNGQTIVNQPLNSAVEPMQKVRSGCFGNCMPSNLLCFKVWL